MFPFLFAACTSGYGDLDSGPRPEKIRTDYPVIFPDQEMPVPDQKIPKPDRGAPDGPTQDPDLPLPSCNNNDAVEDDEICDGTDMAGHTCETESFDGGDISCSANCTLDTSGCFRCGDNTVNGDEVCDGSDLNSLTCATLGQGFDGGNLSCDSGCTFNVSGCTITCTHPAVTPNCASNFCQIPAGCFSMGSPPDEPCREDGETQHNVSLTHDIEFMQNSVTQAEYQALIGSNPSYSAGCANCPVENLDWHTAIAYCNTLSANAGYAECYTCAAGVCTSAAAYSEENIYNCPGYRLPTEAEAEYAYRAGTTGAIYQGTYTGHTALADCINHLLPDADLSPIGWFAENSGEVVMPVGSKAPNAWGLYDMAGNVAEWTHDRNWDIDPGSVINPWGGPLGDDRSVRGGHIHREAAALRAGFRLSVHPDEERDWVGFRCVRTTSF